MKSHILVTEIPLGWTKSQRHNARVAMDTLGVQSGYNPSLKMHIKPNVGTTWNYDEDGHKTTPKTVGTKWILTGDMTDVTDEDVDNVIAEELNVNPVAVAAKAQKQRMTHEEYKVFIYNNAAVFGETVA